MAANLADLYTATLTAVGIELSQLRKMKIEEAAQLKSLAEKARGDFVRDGVGSLDDVRNSADESAAWLRRFGSGLFHTIGAST
jgi:hypothetical protein